MVAEEAYRTALRAKTRTDTPTTAEPAAKCAHRQDVAPVHQLSPQLVQ